MRAASKAVNRIYIFRCSAHFAAFAPRLLKQKASFLPLPDRLSALRQQKVKRLFDYLCGFCLRQLFIWQPEA